MPHAYHLYPLAQNGLRLLRGSDQHPHSNFFLLPGKLRRRLIVGLLLILLPVYLITLKKQTVFLSTPTNAILVDMTAEPPTPVTGPRKGRSRVSNGSQALIFGDGRSAGARRYRDLQAEFAAELGNAEALPPSSRQLVRRLAQVSVELELLEAKRASGDEIDPIAFVTLVNSQRRLFRDLHARAERVAKEKPPTLAEALAAGRSRA